MPILAKACRTVFQPDIFESLNGTIVTGPTGNHIQFENRWS
jgi:hypothetical protein